MHVFSRGDNATRAPHSTIRTALKSLRVIFIILLIGLIPGISYGVVFSKSSTITGNASVVGLLTKGTGSFVIDHPLDPRNSLLVFSFVESPEVKNIYDGTTTLDDEGNATIELPDYFLALNMDYRYLATPIGKAMPDLHLKKGVSKKYAGLFGPIVFSITGGIPHGEISWQVSGVRHDRFILEYPIVPEVPKADSGLVEPGECLFEPLCI